MKFPRLFAVVAAATITLAGCAADDTDSGTDDEAAAEPAAPDEPADDETPEPDPEPEPEPEPMVDIVDGPVLADATVIDWDQMFSGEMATVPGMAEVHTGTGDAIVDLETPIRLAAVSAQHRGSSNFQVRAYYDSGDERGLVNEIGNYTGQTLAAQDGALESLDVTADGEWALVVTSIQLAPNDDNVARTYEGVGDALVVFPLSGDNPQPVTAFDRATFTHDGDSNFQVRQLLMSGLINEIGPYHGTVRLDSDGLYGFEIIADGPWTINLE